MKKFFKSAAVLSVLGAAILLLTSCGGSDTVAAVAISDSILVSTVSPEIGDIHVMGEYIGTMQPNQQVAVLPRLPGEVLSVYFNVGDTVNAGDVLFTIDAAEIEANITALEAQLDVQDAMVRAAQTGVLLVDGSAMQSQILSADGGVNQTVAAISQAELNVEQSRIAVEQAQMGYDLAEQGFLDATVLYEGGVISRNAFEQAEAGYLNAQAGLERALGGYSLATIGLSQAEQGLQQALEGQRILMEDAPAENRRRAQDGLAQAEAARNAVYVNLEAIRDRLDDSVVTAPINGVIEMRNVEEFGFAAPGQPAFLISDHDSMTVSFRVPRSAAAILEIGDGIILFDGEEEHNGAITEIATMVDFGGLLEIRANIPNPPEILLSGMSVRIFATAQRAENVLILPLNAVHHDRGFAHVFVAQDGFAVRTPVEMGVFDANYAQIISGISPDDQVINSWNVILSDGVEIEVSQ
ncbi:MAG: efflux RND transporter periplasmic adaptor subunit [Defluviitaleaceae bacterium]|nr:efflux RND transporter periplasmic adaptor subunit [Defluviitaleaceae bacterium]